MDSLKHAPLRIYDIRNKYKVIDKVGRGTYGTVYKVLNLEDNKYYAIKKFQNTETKLQVQGFPITALRQISLLKQLNHPHIINLKQIICSKPNKRNLFRGSTFLVFQYMHHDFSGLFRAKIKFQLSEIKSIMKQILEGCDYLHKNKIMHRDIKSANILLNDQGIVQLADFGLGRRTRFQTTFTYKVVTLWYRAPELLLGCKNYNHKIDVWSIGCVFAEFLLGQVLFKKETQYSIIQKIYQICGDLEQNQYTQEYLRGCVYYHDMKPKKSFKNNLINYIKKQNAQVDQLSLIFLKGLLQLNPYKRFSCQQALNHQYFNTLPYPCEAHQIKKLDVEYHQMFRDRSLKIQRQKRKQSASWTDQQQLRRKNDQKIQRIQQNYRKPSQISNIDIQKNIKYQKNYQRKPYHYQNKYDQKKYQYIRKESRQIVDRRQNKNYDRKQYRQKQNDSRTQQRYHKKHLKSSSSSSSQSLYRRSRNKKHLDNRQSQDRKYKSSKYSNQKGYNDKNNEKQKYQERDRTIRPNYQRQSQNGFKPSYNRYDNGRFQRTERDSKNYRQTSSYQRDYRDRNGRQDNLDRYHNKYQKNQRQDRYQTIKPYLQRQERKPYYQHREQKEKYYDDQYKHYNKSDKYQNSDIKMRKQKELKNYLPRESRPYVSQNIKNYQEKGEYKHREIGQRDYQGYKRDYQGYTKQYNKDSRSRDMNFSKISIQKKSSSSPKRSMNYTQY